MFYAKQDTRAGEPVSFTIRVKGVSANAAQTAAQGISSAYQAAAAGVGKGVRQGVYITRVWTAPRLESAADYHTTTIAPKVSSALVAAANQIRPADARKKSRSMLTWSVLAAAVLATAGAVAALVKFRYRAETEADEEEFDAGVAPAGATTGAQSSTPATADSAATGADTGVNGRVSTSG